ncbi:helix-turn-helix domain-containing protein [Fulvivirgaceae bacterium BMA12]|uniref:Helix-turn-helix domain-containing protein n=1 Tax=Agaribacillus aureus TaxID=3051825 RepID=A0ABT8LKC8_9BACT|nr:helix-turn-helix domain-containing protein [Fulvivirgaceae bacterium BMA12]
MLSKKEQRKEKTREAIKQAAIKVAAKEGWNNVTIRKIADEVLYTPPIVYEFFEGKDDLYRHLVIDGFEKLKSSTFAAIEPLGDPGDKLVKMAEVRLDFATKNQTLHHMMFDAENPQWQKEELVKSLHSLKMLVQDLLIEISGSPDSAEAYFLNLICLIKGYTYFNNQLIRNPKMRKKFSNKDVDMKILFLDAIKRFIKSIKS